ncbi:hypothetical protein RHOFW104R8_13410 [Rhodanobacter sp. FW104-R8]|nr:hypothetical protein RHOFW104R8_13410 [Rhodanobacter sp. FW104-R8]KZC28557.1 hypothetical protein RhoFW510T8_10650 [Rhodanobacter sp. FW510-T8]
MVKPDASRHDPRPEYLRALIEKSGLSQVECARLLGIDGSTMRRYLASRTATAKPAPYPVQYALEQLAASKR